MQLLLGLNHPYRREVAHCDLKPANILVENPLSIANADFVLSKPNGAKRRRKGAGELHLQSLVSSTYLLNVQPFVAMYNRDNQ
jgi:serine/threonine protein kinase